MDCRKNFLNKMRNVAINADSIIFEYVLSRPTTIHTILGLKISKIYQSLACSSWAYHFRPNIFKIAVNTDSNTKSPFYSKISKKLPYRKSVNFSLVELDRVCWTQKNKLALGPVYFSETNSVQSTKTCPRRPRQCDKTESWRKYAQNHP